MNFNNIFHISKITFKNIIHQLFKVYIHIFQITFISNFVIIEKKSREMRKKIIENRRWHCYLDETAQANRRWHRRSGCKELKSKTVISNHLGLLLKYETDSSLWHDHGNSLITFNLLIRLAKSCDRRSYR